MRPGIALLAAVLASPALAETVVPARTIPARSILMPEDLMLAEGVVQGALSDPAAAIGLETRVALYPGRPIRAGDLGPPAVVDRNAIVPLVFRRDGLVITAEGRALDRAGPGDTIRVMNIASRTIVTALMGADGAAYVSP